LDLTGLLAPGRPLRAIAAWLGAALLAALFGATLTISFLMVRESVFYAPFRQRDWWMFLNMWRPLVAGAMIAAPLLSAPLAAILVLTMRKQRWRRPLADILGGAVVGIGSFLLLALIARLMIHIGEA
jgi:hypothetical protein